MSELACLRVGLFASTVLISAAGVALADCLPPEPPWLPSGAADVRIYADLIRADFENYIAEVQEYFRCLDAERARAFAEAQEVSREYVRFQNMMQK